MTSPEIFDSQYVGDLVRPLDKNSAGVWEAPCQCHVRWGGVGVNQIMTVLAVVWVRTRPTSRRHVRNFHGSTRSRGAGEGKQTNWVVFVGGKAIWCRMYISTCHVGKYSTIPCSLAGFLEQGRV